MKRWLLFGGYFGRLRNLSSGRGVSSLSGGEGAV